jgi:glycosyltransferase involved in cell wall biosynthesis
MRVAFFSETFLPKVDGLVTVICLLLDHLAKRNIESVMVIPHMGANSLKRYADTRLLSVPAVPFPFYTELKLGLPLVNTYRELRAFDPQIVHVFQPIVAGNAGLLIAKQMRIPAVASLHLDLARITHHYGLGAIEPLVNLAARIVFNAADTALAPSRLMQNEMQQRGIRKVVLWGRGVDAERFNPHWRSTEMRERLSDGHPDDIILLYVGRLSPEKQLMQIRAVLEQVPDTRLALVGDGPDRAKLEQHFAGLPVVFMGYQQGEVLSQAYGSADVFVFPSALETFGLVVTEAMAAGLPVVASRVGGVSDVVTEGVNGYTFDVGDTQGLINGVRRVTASQETMHRMSAAARAFAETQTWEVMMDEVIDLYTELVEKRSQRRLSVSLYQ